VVKLMDALCRKAGLAACLGVVGSNLGACAWGEEGGVDKDKVRWFWGQTGEEGGEFSLLSGNEEHTGEAKGETNGGEEDPSAYTRSMSSMASPTIACRARNTANVMRRERRGGLCLPSLLSAFDAELNARRIAFDTDDKRNKR
jgi:hypothetical protein